MNEPTIDNNRPWSEEYDWFKLQVKNFYLLYFPKIKFFFKEMKFLVTLLSTLYIGSMLAATTDGIVCLFKEAKIKHFSLKMTFSNSQFVAWQQLLLDFIISENHGIRNLNSIKLMKLATMGNQPLNSCLCRWCAHIPVKFWWRG